MYVTRPLSWYRKHPSALSKNPEEPFSGYLVITDEEAQAEDTFCLGMCRRRGVHKLPFPQDKLLTVYHLSGIDETMRTKVWFLPVIGQPLSSNRYYAIKAKGRYKGQVCKCSKEAEMGFCCFSNYINDKRPRPFDHRDIYQQVKIHRHYRHTFFAKSVAPDGIPPKFLKKKGWKVRSSKSYRSELNEALGLDVTARSLLPSLDFPIYNKHSHTVVVGKWCCPFVFVREEYRLREQMKKSLLYKMTLEQRWEEIFSCQNVNNESRVNVDVDVQREVNLVFGMEALKEIMNGEGGFVWYRGRNQFNGRGVRLGLSSAIVEKMRWVQEVGGFVDGGERVVRVERMEEIDGERVWRRFGFYVLVESFNLRRWDGTLIMKSQFRHTNHIQCKWE